MQIKGLPEGQTVIDPWTTNRNGFLMTNDPNLTYGEIKNMLGLENSHVLLRGVGNERLLGTKVKLNIPYTVVCEQDTGTYLIIQIRCR